MTSDTEDFTIEKAYQQIEEFETKLKLICPSPNEVRLLELGKEYTNPELRALLQTFGSYLASLRALQGKISAEGNMLKKALKTGMAMATLAQHPEGSTVAEKEAKLLNDNVQLMHVRKMQIKSEMYLDIIKGWVDAYDDAYTAVSRIVSLQLGDESLATARHS